MKDNQVSDTVISLEVDSSALSYGEGETAGRTIAFRRRLRRLIWHVLARQLTLFCVVVVSIAGWIGRRRRKIDASEGREIMLTGRFDSVNWILAHLGPLSASQACSRVWMISTNPVPALPKVEGIYPAKWLVKVVGATPARLWTFLWAAVRKRPHIVGGFHLIPNGIMAIIVGHLTGIRSMYFCVGGPAEARDGGIQNEAGFLARMETADTVVERRLLRMVSQCDRVVTMGTRAVTFFREKGIKTQIDVVSGGIDSHRFHPNGQIPSIDMILTGRLVHIKRIDVFLRTIQKIKHEIPNVRAVVVGDGPLREELRSLASDLGVSSNVEFVGHKDDLENWLRLAAVFVLSSDSEGLSLSLMEAMMCGLPAVVSNVGDLGDLVEDDVNGHLVCRRSPKLFAERIIMLLSDKHKLSMLSDAARRSALRFATEATAAKWDDILTGFRES